MRLELDLPEVRRWQIRAEAVEQQASLARQKEAAFRQRLRKLADTTGALETALDAAQEAARVAEQEKRREEDAVARLQCEIGRVRESQQEAQQRGEELQWQRAALEERLRTANAGLTGPGRADEGRAGSANNGGESILHEENGSEARDERAVGAGEGPSRENVEHSAVCGSCQVPFATDSGTGSATSDGVEGAAPATTPEAAVGVAEQALQEGSDEVKHGIDPVRGSKAAWPGIAAVSEGGGGANEKQEVPRAQNAQSDSWGCEGEGGEGSECSAEGSDVASANEAPTVVLETQADCSPLGGQLLPQVHIAVVDLDADSSASTYSSAQSSRSSTEASNKGRSHEGAGVHLEAPNTQVTADVKVQEWLDAESAVAMKPTGVIEHSRMTQALDDSSASYAPGEAMGERNQ